MRADTLEAIHRLAESAQKLERVVQAAPATPKFKNFSPELLIELQKLDELLATFPATERELWATMIRHDIRRKITAGKVQ
jgi:hypothetical protein